METGARVVIEEVVNISEHKKKDKALCLVKFAGKSDESNRWIPMHKVPTSLLRKYRKRPPPVKPEKILKRKRENHTWKYELHFARHPHCDNIWATEEEIRSAGFGVLVEEYKDAIKNDEQQQSKPNTKAQWPKPTTARRSNAMTVCDEKETLSPEPDTSSMPGTVVTQGSSSSSSSSSTTSTSSTTCATATTEPQGSLHYYQWLKEKKLQPSPMAEAAFEVAVNEMNQKQAAEQFVQNPDESEFAEGGLFEQAQLLGTLDDLDLCNMEDITATSIAEDVKKDDQGTADDDLLKGAVPKEAMQVESWLSPELKDPTKETSLEKQQLQVKEGEENKEIAPEKAQGTSKDGSTQTPQSSGDVSEHTIGLHGRWAEEMKMIHQNEDNILRIKMVRWSKKYQQLLATVKVTPPVPQSSCKIKVPTKLLISQLLLKLLVEYYERHIVEH